MEEINKAVPVVGARNMVRNMRPRNRAKVIAGVAGAGLGARAAGGVARNRKQKRQTLAKSLHEEVSKSLRDEMQGE